LKQHATRIINELSQEKRPVLITERGRPRAYLVDLETFPCEQFSLALRLATSFVRPAMALLTGFSGAQFQKPKVWVSPTRWHSIAEGNEQKLALSQTALASPATVARHATLAAHATAPAAIVTQVQAHSTISRSEA